MKHALHKHILTILTATGMFAVASSYSISRAADLYGNDDVWVASSPVKQLVYMAGSDTKGHPAGTKPGDILHVFSNGTLQILTDVSIDPAGNVWAADNWDDASIATGLSHDPARSTLGGGNGVTVLYGAAPPVKPPRMGPVKRY